MQNRFKAIILIVLIAFGVIYTYYWFKKADDFKRVFEQNVAQVNDIVQKQFDKNITAIKYESLSVTGFPSSIQINMNKPVFTIPVLAISQNLFHKTPSANIKAAVIEVTYADRVSLSGNVFANYFTISYAGESTIKPIINNQPGKTVLSDSSTPFTCHLRIHNPDSLPWNVPAAFSDYNSFFDAFRAADCSISGSVLKYEGSNTLLSTIDKFTLSAGDEPMGSVNRKITMTLDVKNAKATPAYDETAQYYAQLFYDITGTPAEQRQTDFGISQYGEQNSAVDISYEGPTDKKYFTDPSTTIRLDINALKAKNALYETESEAHLSSLLQGADRNSAVIIHSWMQAGDAYEQLLTNKMTQFFTQLAKLTASGNPWAVIAASSDPHQLATAIVPKFKDIGKVSFDSDIHAKGSKDKVVLEDSDISVNNLDLTNGKYGLKIKGNGKTATGRLATGDWFATCVACDEAIDKIGNYAIGIDSIIAKTRPGQIPYVTKPLIEGFKKFLHALNDTASNKEPADVVVRIVVDDKGKVTISGKELMEVVGLFGVNVGQSLQPAKPAAAATPQAAPAPAAAMPAAPAKAQSAK